MEGNSGRTVESVHRALVVIKLLIEEGSLGVIETAGALGVNGSTAQRILATLVQDGFAVQSSDRRYHLGPALQNPGLLGSVPKLTERLRPALESAFDRTGETIHLSSLVGTRVQNLDGIEATAHTLRFGLRVGVWLPAHIASGGKVLLSEFTDDEVIARYNVALAGPQGRSIDVDMPALLDQLEEIRETRVAWNFEQSEPGIAAVSVAIGEPGGQRGALSVAAPIARYTRDLGDQWTEGLLEIADQIAAGHPNLTSSPRPPAPKSDTR